MPDFDERNQQQEPQQETIQEAPQEMPADAADVSPEKPEGPKVSPLEEMQASIRQRRGSGKRKTAFLAIPVVIIIIVVLMGMRTNVLISNDAELKMSDEVLTDAMALDPSAEGDPIDGLSLDDADFIRQVVRLINTQRASAGLAPMTMEARLIAAAQIRAHEAATSDDTLTHTRPDGSHYRSAISAAGVQSGLTGEIIGSGYETPEDFVNALMQSESHKAYLMSEEYQYIGVGIAPNQEGAKYGAYVWCQLFAK